MSGVEPLLAHPRIAAEARAWVFRLAAEPDLPEAEHDALLQWRGQTSEHDAAFALALRTWRGLAETATARDDDWRDELRAIRRRPWRVRPAAWIAVPVALAASLAAVALVPPLLAPPGESIATATAQNRVVALDDGSRLTVGAQSGVEVRFAADRREVVLDHGQAFFEVAHDSARPFYVLAGRAEIRVTGTRFDVRRVGDGVEVSVLEGRVELRRRPLLPLVPAFLRQPTPERVLTAGEESDLRPGAGTGFAPERKAEVPAGEWRDGRLYYVDAPLAEVVADAARYSRIAVTLRDPALGQLRVTTSFRAGDVKGFVGNLEAVLPVRGRPAADGTIELAAR